MTVVKTGSDNTVKAYEFLRDNPGAHTIKQIAEALGLSSAQVTGGVVSLAKKDILEKTDVQVDDKTYKAFECIDKQVTFEFEQKSSGKMTDKGVQLLQFLQENDGADMTAAEIAEEMGMQAIAVNGVLNGLVKKGFAEREEVIVEMPDGKEKEVKIVKMTDEGRAYKF